MSGQLSPDGNYYWDGVRWANAATPDGAWRWDGRSWQPASKKSSRMTNQTAVLIAAGVIVALLVTGGGLFFLTRAFIGAQQTLQSKLGPACTEGGMSGGAVSEGATLCGRKLGAGYIDADCTTLSSLPPSLVSQEIASAGAGWTPADIGMDSGGCHFVSQPKQDVAIDSNEEYQPELVLIADFVPHDRLGAIGLRLACTKENSCVDVSLYADDESFSLDEGTPGDSWKNLTTGPLLLGFIQFGALNRLILRFVGGVASVYLNGYEVTHATPDINQVSGYLGFYADNQHGSADEHVDLLRLYVFQAL